MEKVLNRMFPDWERIGWTDRTVIVLFFLSMTWIKLAPICIVLLLILCFVNRRTSEEIKKMIINWRTPIFWSICFWLYHLVAMNWSTNKVFGWSDIGMKISFLIFPVIVAIGSFSLSSKQFLENFLKVLTYLTIGLLFFAAFRSWYYPEDNQWGYFFEIEFSHFIHRSYFATYTAFGSGMALNMLLFDKGSSFKTNLLSWFVLSLATFLTISKAGIIIWGIITVFLITYWLLSIRKYIFLLMGLLFFIAFGYFIMNSNTRISSRFKEIPKAFDNVKTVNEKSIESNSARIIMWSTSINLIKDNWMFGVGTGDVKDELTKKNFEYGNTGVAERKLNSHNQFLNTWCQLGIVGFLCLIMIFLTSLVGSIKQKNNYGVVFVLTFFLTLLFESFLETQAGIVPFCMLLAFLNYDRNGSVAAIP